MRHVVWVLLCFLLVGMVRPTYAAIPFTDAYTTLSNARFSFRAQLSAAHSSGTTLITIATAGSASLDEDVYNLFPGDTVCFTSTALAGCQGQTTSTVNNAIANNTIGLSDPGITGNLLATDQMTATQSGALTVTFTPASDVASGGKVVLTIPSASSAFADGFPDATGFDRGRLPTGANGLQAGTGCSVADSCYSDTGFTASDVTLTQSGTNHIVTITLSGALNAGTSYSFRLGTVSAGDATLRFLNPLPSGSSHTRGLADTYSVELKSQNAGQTVTYDDTIMKVAPQDGVFVSAMVEESITYQINDSGNNAGGNIGVAGANSCAGGFTTTVATTPYSVPFGSILNFDTFYKAAQSHYIVTNAPAGYSLTVLSDGPLSTLDGGTTIANGTCDGAPACTTSAQQAWATPGNNGFAYTLGNEDGTDAAFTSNFRLFDDTTARTIMSNPAPTSGSRADICYQLSVDTTQTANYYFNKLYYVATPMF